MQTATWEFSRRGSLFWLKILTILYLSFIFTLYKFVFLYGSQQDIREA